MPFVSRFGQIEEIQDQEQIFLDLNRDGLIDVATMNKEVGVVTTWLNRGKEFKQVHIPNTFKIPEIASSPRAVDLIGSGDDQIIYTAGLGKWQTLAFNRPETGLLTRIDNGKGIEIIFSYQRSPAIPFATTRMPVIGSVRMRKGLSDPLTTTLIPMFPKTDSNGKLLGYSRMESISAGSRKVSTLSIDEELGSAPISIENADDKIPGLKKIQEKSYLGMDFQGLAVRIPKQETEYWVEGQKRSRSLTTSYLAYDRNICPKSTQTTSDGENIFSSLTFSNLPAFEKSLHCKVETEDLVGTHQNPEKDFAYITKIDRTAAGQEQAVWRVIDSKKTLLESAEYDSDFRMVSVMSPGKGTSTVAYHPFYDIPETVINPDGTYTKVAEFDPISTLIVQLDTYRGVAKFSQKFGFDSRDRLTSSTHSLFDPALKSLLTEYTYLDATVQKPGFLRTVSASDDGTGQISRYETAEAFDASARSLGKLLKMDRGWIRTRWADINDASNASRQLWTAGIGGAIQDLLSPDLTKAIELSAEDRTAFGILKSAKLWENGKKEARNTTWHISEAGDLVKETFLNGRTLGKIFANPQGKMTAYVDALNNKFSFEHDALGRVVDVRLPSGTQQHLTFDKFGQALRIDQSQVGSVSYDYYPDSRLLRTKTFYNRVGAIDRTESLAYDGVGRVIKKEFAKGTDVRTFSFSFNQDPGSDQFAFLEAITGPGYKKEFRYREDGKLRSKSLSFFSGPVLKKTFSYTKTDETRQEFWEYFSNGKPIASSQKTYSYDAYGRPKTIAFTNGSIDLGYDDYSRLSELTFGTQRLQINYDSESQIMSGYAANSMRPDRWEFAWHYNADGEVESETYFYPSFGGKTASYSYDERFFLKTAERDNQLSYDFDSDGLGTTIASKDLVQESGRITLGDTIYSFDSSRRIQSKGPDSYEYGPQGRMVRLLRGQKLIASYDYDENSELLAKDSSESVYFFDGGIANSSNFAEPIKINNIIIGFVTNGNFELIPYDNRGTAMPRSDAVKTWAEPFGARTGDPAVPLKFDYAGNYRDSDSGFVVMGARFYDGSLGFFTTPDLFFLEDLRQCEKSPYECNLHSYARNNPLKFIDPSGTNSLVLGGAGYEDETEQYAPVLVSKFASAGVAKPEYVPISSGGQLGNLVRTLVYRDQPFENSTASRGVGALTNFQNTQVKIFHASNRDGGQRNIIGYSYGSVMAAQAALRMANMGIKIDNVGLIGSPISSDSKLYRSLITNPNIGKVSRFDIQNDPFSGGIDFKSWNKLDLPGLATGNHIHFDYMNNDRGQQDQLSREVSNAFNSR
jgi:RHS repeat-associated protein